ncbi:MAG: glycosyltransferase [Nitrososphaerota archaeon]
MFSLHTSPLASLGRTRDAGGMNVYVRELARELGRSGIDVDIFTRRSDPNLPPIQHIGERVRLIQIEAGPVTPLPPTELFPYVSEFTCRVGSFAKRTGIHYDLLHTHYWLSAAAALPLARAWDVPHITMFHTVERLKDQQYGSTSSSSDMAAIRIEHEGRIASTVDRITVSTESEGEQLRRIYGLPACHLAVIPCGVDLRLFAPATPASRQAARTALALDHGQRTLLSIGRLDPIKGLDLLLESVSLMRTPAQLIIIGGNPDGDPEVERLRQRAADLGLAERVRLPGAVPQQDLGRYYHAADAVVVSSRYESFGLVAVEALASGTPVVASAAGGLTSIVQDGSNGLLVRWRDPRAFAERLDEILADDALRARLAANARASVERFGWQRIGDDVRALYQELTADARCIAACSCF